MLLPNEIQVWLHIPTGPSTARKQPSLLARRLLQAALADQGVSVPDGFIETPALDLFDSIRDAAGLETSIAHCPGLISVALSRRRVGIDCERPRSGRNWPEIASSFFTAGENALLTDAPVELREGMFLRFWTLKEAMIKANRGNLWTDINRLVFEPSGIVAREPEGIVDDWVTWQGDYAGATIGVCSAAGRDARFEFRDCRQLSEDNLSSATNRAVFPEGGKVEIALALRSRDSNTSIGNRER